MIHLKKYAALTGLSLIWAGYFLFSQTAVSEYGVLITGFFVRLITFVLLSVILLLKGELALIFRPGKALYPLILIGVFGFLIDLTGFLGLRFSSAAVGTALLKIDILFVTVLSVVLYRRRFAVVEWILTFVMLFAVLLVLDVNLLRFRFSGFGDIFFILSAFFLSCNAFLIKNVQSRKDHPIADNVIAFYNNFITMLLFLAVLPFARDGRFTAGFTVPLLLTGIGQTLIYLAYYYNLRRNEVWLVKIFLLLIPLFVNIVTFFTGAGQLSARQRTGMAVVVLCAAGFIIYDKYRGVEKHVK